MNTQRTSIKSCLRDGDENSITREKHYLASLRQLLINSEAVLLTTSALCVGTTYYVASDGSDAANGQSQYSPFGMAIESVNSGSDSITITTTGATFVLDSYGMDLYRRIDPAINDHDNSNEGKGSQVARVTFEPATGMAYALTDLGQTVVLENENVVFEFHSDSFFFITAKEPLTVTHVSLIENAEWNAPLNPEERDLDRMWTSGYGGSLLAHLSESTKGTVSAEDTDSTTVLLSAGDQTAHMVFPAKLFDFEGLYGHGARPFVDFVYSPNRMTSLMEPNAMDLRTNEGFGVFVIFSGLYENRNRPGLLITDPNVLGYNVLDPILVKSFINLAHFNGFKVISYLFTPNHDVWTYPTGHANEGQRQPTETTLDWMRAFQAEWDLDGWYFDNANTSDNLIDDYRFIRQVRTDIGDEGVIFHHDSVDIWGNDNVYGSYSGLRAIMINSYVNYTLVGETGEIAEIDSPNDLYFRYFTCGYGLSQAYASHKRKSDGKMSLSEEEKNRVLAENLHGCERNVLPSLYTTAWITHFKPFYEMRKAEYNHPDIPFDPDVDWPIDPNNGWFRSPTNINSYLPAISWITDQDATSEVTLSTNGTWCGEN